MPPLVCAMPISAAVVVLPARSMPFLRVSARLLLYGSAHKYHSLQCRSAFYSRIAGIDRHSADYVPMAFHQCLVSVGSRSAGKD